MGNIPTSKRDFLTAGIDFSSDGSGAISSGLANLGSTLNRGAAILETGRRLDLKNKETQALQEIQERYSARMKELDEKGDLTRLSPPELIQDLAQNIAPDRERMISDLPFHDEDEKEQFKSRLDETVDAAGLAASEVQQGRIRLESVQRLGVGLQRLHGMVRSGEMGGRDALDSLKLSLEEAGELLSAEEQETAFGALGRSLLLSEVDAYAANNQFDEAEQLLVAEVKKLDADQEEAEQPFLSNEEIEYQKQKLEKRKDVAEQGFRRQTVADFRDAIDAAQDEEVFEGLRAQLDHAVENGHLLESQYEFMMNRLIANQEKKAVEHNMLDRVLGVMDGSEPPLDHRDERHRAGVDLYFQHRVSGVEDEDYFALAREVVSDTGIVPDQLKSRIRAYLNAGDDAEALQAVKMIGHLDHIGRLDQAGFSSDDIALATIASGYIDAGIRDENALKRARDMLAPASKEIRAARAEQLEELGVDYQWEALAATVDHVQKSFLGVLGYKSRNPGYSLSISDRINNDQNWYSYSTQIDTMWNDFPKMRKLYVKPGSLLNMRKMRDEFIASGGVSERLASDYKQVFDYWFLKTGSELEAVRMAKKDIRKKWSMTFASGHRRLMAYAPEAVYGVLDNGLEDSQWMFDQLYNDWALSNNWEEGPKLQSEKLYLTLVPGTDHQPRYHLHVIQEDDTQQPVMDRNRPGELWEWAPEWKRSPYYEMFKQDQARQKQEAREKMRLDKEKGS